MASLISTVYMNIHVYGKQLGRPPPLPVECGQAYRLQAIARLQLAAGVSGASTDNIDVPVRLRYLY